MNLVTRLDQLRDERLAAVARDHDRSVERAVVRCFNELRDRDDAIGHAFAAHTPSEQNLTHICATLNAQGIVVDLHPRYTGGRLVIEPVIQP